ncbi:hypothetical protein KCP71_20670 [Salmonella enterica subsp. enterica]|nr:hypothetical protein KCP71_20670 [Salmonella enterica subsp. enterica]
MVISTSLPRLISGNFVKSYPVVHRYHATQRRQICEAHFLSKPTLLACSVLQERPPEPPSTFRADKGVAYAGSAKSDCIF